jgi:hypothetical protein
MEATLKPQVAFSQNAGFDIMPSSIDNEFGYFWGAVDAPQRFGDEPFFTYDWGDSEIRYTWKNLTIGFGTQTPWLGPAYLNPILHSNNAPTYPKFDIGLRRQRVTLPWLGWYIGDVEARIWTGRLEESNYFDNDDSNDYRMFHGLAVAYAPSFAPGLTLFANRVSIVPWAWENLQYMLPVAKNADWEGDVSGEDQKASLGFSYLFPKVSFEVYGEIGIDDYVPGGIQDDSLEGYIRYPFHTMVYTVGMKKKFNIYRKKQIYGEVLFEWNNMEMSQNFQFFWPYSPYFHGSIRHGYTNKGQWLGNGNSWAGVSQHLECKIYYPQGMSAIFIQRNNPDNNFLYSKAVYDSAESEELQNYYYSFKANFIVGLSTLYFVTKNFSIGGSVMYNLIINPEYFYKSSIWGDEFIHNFVFHLTGKYAF